MTVKIHTATARAALEPRRESYWTPLGGAGAGRFIGYRKMLPNKKGLTVETWMARARDRDTGKQRWLTLAELTPTNDYDAACKAAREWFTALDEGVVTEGRFTVEMACKEYVEHQRREKGDEAAEDAEWRFERSGIYGGTKFGLTEVTKLRAVSVREWRAKLGVKDAKGRKMGKSGQNRMMTCLRAALNLAVENDRVPETCRKQWRGGKKGKVQQYSNADGRRHNFFTVEQRRALLAAAPEGETVRDLMEAALLTGARPGELPRAKRRDYDATTGTIKLKSGKSGSRDVTLSPVGATLFDRIAKDKSPDTSLFTREGGEPWTRIEWSRRIRAAAEAAAAKAAAEAEAPTDPNFKKLTIPPDVCLYDFRHTYISQAILDGVTILEVARLTGTSVQMIQKHYGHLVQQDSLRERLAKVQML
jgi:integrase